MAAAHALADSSMLTLPTEISNNGGTSSQVIASKIQQLKLKEQAMFWRNSYLEHILLFLCSRGNILEE